METLLIKVDTKENEAFLRELLLKFNFVVEVKSKPDSIENPETPVRNAGGLLNAYANKDKIKEEKFIWESVVKLKHGVH